MAYAAALATGAMPGLAAAEPYPQSGELYRGVEARIDLRVLPGNRIQLVAEVSNRSRGLVCVRAPSGEIDFADPDMWGEAALLFSLQLDDSRFDMETQFDHDLYPVGPGERRSFETVFVRDQDPRHLRIAIPHCAGPCAPVEPEPAGRRGDWAQAALAAKRFVITPDLGLVRCELKAGVAAPVPPLGYSIKQLTRLSPFRTVTFPPSDPFEMRP